VRSNFFFAIACAIDSSGAAWPRVGDWSPQWDLNP
jgi:hypothetical protein